MTSFKVTLTCPVTLTATLEFKMEAEDEDKAYELAFEEHKRQDREYQEKLQEYHRTLGSYPEAPFYWHVDDDDIENNMNEHDIEIDSVVEDD